MKCGIVAASRALLCVAAVAMAAAATAAEPLAGDRPVLDEIVVTAMRRQMDLQQVPLAVSVLTAAKLEALRVTTIDGIPGQVPNLAISAVGNNTPWVFLRGAGLTDINANASGSVGIYQDGIYQNSTATQLQQLHDVERIEVLRGPQGTLYGRNTTGGVINIVSAKPQPGNSLETRLGYGRFNQLDLQLTGNLAIREDLQARLALVRHRRDPLFDNTNGTGDASDVDNWAARAMLRYRPAGQDWLFSVHGSSVDARASAYDKSLIAENPDRADVGSPRSEPLSWPGHEKVDVGGATAIGDVELGQQVLTSVTGYLRSKRDSRLDLDSSAPDWLDQRRLNEARQYSQEFRLRPAQAGPLDWTLGVYAFREDLDATVLLRASQALGVPALTFLSETQYSQRDATAAAFADATWRLSSRLTLFGGARLTWEEKTFETSQQGYFNAPLATSRQRQSWTEPSGGLGLSYALAEQIEAYLRLDRGFRAGGFNAGGGVDDPAYDPEYVNSGEIGLKSVLADGRLRLNAAAFHGVYRDMQVYALVASPAGPTTQYLTNAARATARGVEVEASWLMGRQWRLDLSGGYLDARFDRYVDGTSVDRSGNRLPGAPRFTAGAVLQYTQPLRGGAGLLASVDLDYRDDFYFDSANTARFAADARGLLGARLSWSSPGGRYGVALWGRNLTDEVYFIRANSFLNLDSIAIGEPRTLGLDLTMRFQ